MSKPSSASAGSVPASNTVQEALLVGLDWGTATTCLIAARRDHADLLAQAEIPTLVGYAKDNLLEGVLPGNARTLCGQAALRHRRHLNLVRPLCAGSIADRAAAHDFIRHLGGLLPERQGEIQAVIGVPSLSTPSAREYLRAAVAGVFHRVIFVPTPFLAALGCREESRLGDSSYEDPALNSLIIDLGAGTTSACLVLGRYPTVDDQASVAFGGDDVDRMILEAALESYPDSALNLERIRGIKEQHSFVGGADSYAPAIAQVNVGGKSRALDLTGPIAAGGEAILQKAFDLTRMLLERADAEVAPALLQNILVTGGGSLVRGFGVALQTRLLEEGYENPRVRVLGATGKELVARGALKIARRAEGRHWQHVLG